MKSEVKSTDLIAIVGMACRLPGGVTNPTELWDLLKNGTDAITEVPSSRWAAEEYYDPDPSAPGKMTTKFGGFIEDFDKFDPVFFKIAPREAENMDPQQRILLETVWEAFENANINPKRYEGANAGVFIGVFANDYSEFQLADRRALNIYTGTGINESIVAGRVSYVFGFEGPAVAVNTACSSSLVSIHLAMQSLRSGESSVAVAGGVNLILSPKYTIVFSKANMMASDGRCKTFDERANGYVRSEGCGILILKRLEDAKRDGDNIRAIISGSAVNQDGASMGLTAPNGLAQEKLIGTALHSANLKADQVGYIEAHGTGTSLGDPIEFGALQSVFASERSVPLYIGSIKSNIGHAESAAGVAGVIKTVLSLEHGEIPPNLHFQKPNPNIDLDSIPAIVPVKPITWPKMQGRRIAGVSSFAFSGTNAHVVVEGYDETPEERPLANSPLGQNEVFCLSAASASSLKQLKEKYLKFLKTNPQVSLRALCYNASAGRAHFQHRVAIVATQLQQIEELLADKASDAAAVFAREAQSDSRLGFLFSGQGSQYFEMGKELYASNAVYRAAFDEASVAVEKSIKLSAADVIFSKKDLIDNTYYTQPCLFVVEYALARMWVSYGLRPQVLIGHSVGEFAAGVISEIFSVEDAARLISARAKLMTDHCKPGGMLAVMASQEDLTSLVEKHSGKLGFAAINGPGSVVISGELDALEKFEASVLKIGKKAKRLAVSHAFHSNMMEPMLEDFRKVAENLDYSIPSIKIISSMLGKEVDEEMASPNYWVNHVKSPVLFYPAMKEALESTGTFLEIGPGSTLSGIAKMAFSEQEETIVTTQSLKKGKSDQRSIAEAIAELYVSGVSVDWSKLLGLRSSYRHLDLPTYAFERTRYWTRSALEDSVGHGDRIHPLLGVRVETKDGSHTIFQGSIGISSQSYFKDHLVYEFLVVPGATYGELIVSCLKNLTKSEHVHFQEFTIERPIILSLKGATSIQVELTKEEDYTVVLCSRADQDSEWIVNVRAKGSALENPEEQSVKIDELVSTFSKKIGNSECYSTFAKIGLPYGEKFRGMIELYRAEKQALGHLKLHPDLEQENAQYNWHPTLLDACYQVMYSHFVDANLSDGSFAYIPLNIESFEFYRKTPAEVWCHIEYKKLPDEASKMITADFNIYDVNGDLISKINNFTFVKATKEAIRKSLAQTDKKGERDWVFTKHWVPYEVSKVGSVTEGKDSVYLALNGGGFAQYFQVKNGAKLKSLVAEIESLSLSDAAKGYDLILAKFKELKEKFNVNSVVLGFSGMDQAPDAIGSAIGKSLSFNLNVLKAFVASGLSSSSRLVLLTTSGIAEKIQTGHLSPWASALWGFQNAISREIPDFKILCLDIDSSDSSESIAKKWPQVETALADHRMPSQALLRSGQFFVPLLRRAETNEGAPLVFDAEGVSIVTGGLGSLGIEVANWIASNGGKRLVLVSRRKPDDRIATKLDQLRSQGCQVSVFNADVGNLSECRKMIDHAKGIGNLQLIVHAAGEMNNKYLMDESAAGIISTLKGKALGAWNIEQCLGDAKVRLVYFSSGSALLPAPGQSSYAAANSVLDELAARRSLKGLPITNVNWGVWDGEGMGQAAQWEKAGVHKIPISDGFNLLTKFISGDVKNVAVLPFDWERFIKTQPPGSDLSLLKEIAGKFIKANEEGPVASTSTASKGLEDVELVGELRGVEENKRRDVVSSYIKKIVSTTLGFASGTPIEPRKGLMSMGMDSLTAVEFRNTLKKKLGSLGKSVSATLVFSYPTVEALTDYIMKEVLPSDLGGGGAKPTETKKKVRSGAMNEPIAVVGMSCRLPGGANDLSSYWQLLASGADLVSEIPKERWDHSAFYEADKEKEGKIYAKTGGFLKGIDISAFDSEFFGIAPKEVVAMDPQHRLALEVGWEALENAGIPPGGLFGSTNTGVFVGIMWTDYWDLWRFAEDAHANEPYICTGNAPSAASGRLAYVLGTQGPTVSIDGACGSSLITVHLASQSLKMGECDIALAGGVNLLLSPEKYLVMSRVRALSLEGHSKTFDEKADGYVRAEGCGMVVLKRLSDAKRDRDRILAVIKGSAMSHVGRAVSFMAPNGAAHENLIRSALNVAGVAPADVGYVEAHGTGTPLGDPIEVQALSNVLKEGRQSPLLLASAKANLGHAESTAGIAGFIKTVLALTKKQIPPHINCHKLNPKIDLESIPAVIPNKLTNWEPINGKRIAGISSFGLTGMIAHAIVEEAPVENSTEPNKSDRDYHLYVLSAKSLTALRALAKKNMEFFEGFVGERSLADDCYTSIVGRTHFNCRLAIVCKSHRDLISELKAFSENGESRFIKVRSEDESEAKVSLMFSGQGSQYLGMGKKLYETNEVFKKSINQCQVVSKELIDKDILKIMFEDEESLNNTRYTQLALFALEYSLAQMWFSWGVRPEAVIGHSVGEYVAAVVAGVLSLEDGMKLLNQRAKLMVEKCKAGAMLAVSCEPKVIKEIEKDFPNKLSLAAKNGQRSFVLSGEFEDIDKLDAYLATKNVRHTKLVTSHAFHSFMMDPMLDDFERFAETLTFKEPQIPFVSNVFGKKAEKGQITNGRYWRNHVRECVNFDDGVRTLAGEGSAILLEIGPGTTLTGLATSALGEQVMVSHSLRPKRDDWCELLCASASLFVSGAELNWKSVEKGFPERRKVELPTYAFQRFPYWFKNVQNGILAIDAKVPASVSPNVDINCFYEISWTMADRKFIQEEGRNIQPVIIFGTDADFSEQIANEIQKRGGKAKVIVNRLGPGQKAPVNFQDIQSIVNAIGEFGGNERVRVISTVAVNRANLNLENIVGRTLLDMQWKDYGANLNIFKALSSAKSQFDLVCVTWNGQKIVAADSRLNFDQASVWGLKRTLNLEKSDLDVSVVDTDKISRDSIPNLVNCLLSVKGQDEIGIRNGVALVPKLKASPMQNEEKQANENLVKKGYTYWVTGGMGAIGKVLVEWILKNGADHVLITGRRDLSQLDSEWVKSLSKGGQVVSYERCDVGEYEECARLCEKFGSMYLPLKGIFHAAGLLVDALIDNQDWEKFCAVFRPKVLGALNLHTLTRSLDLDIFMLFSSGVAVLGNMGQANYAAVNAILDTLSSYRRAMGLSSVSVNWGPWATGGMAMNEETMSLKRSGYTYIEPSVGVRAIEAALKLKKPNLGYYPMDWNTYQNRYSESLASRMLDGLFGPGTGVTGGASTQLRTIGDLIDGKSDDDAKEIVSSEIKSIVRTVMGIGEHFSIETTKGFTALGMDSLMSVEFGNQLRKRLHPDQKKMVSPTTVFDYPNIEVLAGFLLDKVLRKSSESPVNFKPAENPKAMSSGLQSILKKVK